MEFNLSDKIRTYKSERIIYTFQVKEFIKRLKNHESCNPDVEEFIDKLAGDKLIW